METEKQGMGKARKTALLAAELLAAKLLVRLRIRPLIEGARVPIPSKWQFKFPSYKYVCGFQATTSRVYPTHVSLSAGHVVVLY